MKKVLLLIGTLSVFIYAKNCCFVKNNIYYYKNKKIPFTKVYKFDKTYIFIQKIPLSKIIKDKKSKKLFLKFVKRNFYFTKLRIKKDFCPLIHSEKLNNLIFYIDYEKIHFLFKIKKSDCNKNKYTIYKKG